MLQLKLNSRKTIKMQEDMGHIREFRKGFQMERTNEIPTFIKGITQNGYAQMPMKYANLILGNKSNLYRMVAEEGWYLPSKDTRCCTAKYLFGVIGEQYFRIQVSNIKFCFDEKVRLPKIDLVAYMEQNLLNGEKFGFQPESLPDRSWLINVLHTLQPSHPVFTGIEETDKIVEIPLK